MTLRFLLSVAFATAAFSAYAADGTRNQIAVPAHDIARGAVIAEGDFVMMDVSQARARSGGLKDPTAAVGLEARRVLHEGETVRPNDLKRPTIIAKGATVTMMFEAPGIQLSAPGRALGEGGQGETITVLNAASYRQVQAVVIAPGVVRVGPPSPLPNEVAAALN